MKNLFRTLCIAAAVLCAFGLASCNDDDPEPVYDMPGIAVKNVIAASSGVTFTLEPAHAVRYTYAVAPKGEAGTPVAVENGEPSTPTVGGLEADREYTITAIAYGDGGLRSEAVTHDFVTTSRPSVVVGDVTATYKSAEFTLTPVNATAYAYRYTLGSQTGAKTRAAEGEWVRVDGTRPEQVALTGLEADTEYVIEAYATNDEGDGEIVVKPFATLPLPEPLTVATAATSKTIWMKFELCQDLASGYYYYLHDTSYTDDPVTSIETFLEDLKASPDWYTLESASDERLSTGCVSNMDYKLFTVCVDPDGNIDEATALETPVKTKQIDVLRSSQATVTIAGVVPGYITAKADLTASDDCVMGIVQCVSKQVVASVGNITMYVNLNLGNFQPRLAGSFTEAVSLGNIEPETDYYLFTVGIDGQGDYGQLTCQEFTTTPVNYREDVTVGVEVEEEGFRSVSLDVRYNGCDRVHCTYLTDDRFAEWYDGDENKVWQELYSAASDKLAEGTVQLEHLEYNTGYTLFTLPVTSDGNFGMPKTTRFHTAKYTAAGTAALTMTLDGIDREGTRPIARFTLSPGAGCAKFIWMSLSSEIYDNNSAKIGDYIFQSGNYTTSDPAVETRAEVTLWGSDYYLLAAACDADGNWSAVQVSERLVYNPDQGGGGGVEPEPEGDPDEVPADVISATAATVDFISYRYDQSSWNADWSDWDNSVYRAGLTLEAGYTAWYYFVDANSYDWVTNHNVGEGKDYATLALWIKAFGRQAASSGQIAARGDYNTDYLLLVLPETTDGRHSSERVYRSSVYRWSDLTGDVTDPGITGGGEGGGGIEPRSRRR